MFTKELLAEAQSLLDVFRSKGIRLATAESCTGGLLGALLTEISGSSDVFSCGYATYSYESKSDILGVDKSMIESKGAVSEPVATQMAEGARKRAKVEASVGITGIAGPGGGTKEKPVGTVCIAVSVGDYHKVETCHFGGDRSAVRLSSVVYAMDMLKAGAASFSSFA